MKFSLKNNRKLRIGTTATAVTVAVVAVVVLLNVVLGILNDRFPISWDLSGSGMYELGEESMAVAEKVTADMTITVFADEASFKNPSTGYDEYDTISRQLYQFTEQYGKLTDGKIKTEFIDLDANPGLKSNYTKYNVSTGSVLFRSGDQWRAITLDDLYSEEYGDDYYYTGASTITSLVEQKLAANINAVLGGKSVTVTFLTGHGENTQAIALLQDLYEMNGYLTATVDYSTAATIADDTGALVITAPTNDYSADEITRLRAWLKNDGKRERHLFVYANYAADCPNLYEFLEVDYGITVTDKLIVETDEERMPLTYQGSDPYSPLTTIIQTDLTPGADSTNVVMGGTLQLLTSAETDSSKYALTNHAVVTFPESARLETTVDGETKQSEAESYPVVGVAYAYDYEYDAANDNKKCNTYVFVSGSYLTLGYLSSPNYANEELALEPLRAACPLGDVVVISGKNLTAETLAVSAQEAKVVGFWILTVGFPMIFVVLAIVVFVKRRHL